MKQIVITVTLTDEQFKELKGVANNRDWSPGGLLDSLIGDFLAEHTSIPSDVVNTEVKQ